MGGSLSLDRGIRRGANLNISTLKTAAGRSVRHLGTGTTTSETAKIHNCRQQEAGNIGMSDGGPVLKGRPC